MVHRETIGDFIEKELKKRRLSHREFAHQMGSTHTTLARVIEHGNPQIDFLIRLSGYTKVSLERLVAISYPDSVHETPSDAEMLAERINALPTLQRGIILDLINGILFEKPNNGGDKPPLGGR